MDKGKSKIKLKNKIVNKTNEKNKKKIFILILILSFVINFSFIIINFTANKSKNKKIGKNSSNQEIVDYILNISSYEALLNVEVKSNKNSNKYLLKQKYINDDANNIISEQEVIEPSNICGIKIVKNNNELKITNTKLNLNTVLENYNYIGDNVLDLNCFVEDYKICSESNYEEKDNQIIMKTVTNNENKYTKNKILYVDKNTGNPTKMEITDINQNTTINILYKEVKIDELKEKNNLAFDLYNMKTQV